MLFRGGVEDTRLKAKAKDTKKNPRQRTALPRTDTLEAKDRNARGKGQGPRTQTQVFSKKKVFKNFFSGNLKQKGLQNFFSGNLKKKGLQKLFQAIYKISAMQKIVLSSSREQGNFGGLEALRPRTSKCVLKAKNVLEDSTSN